MPRAIQVMPDNLDAINEFANARGFNLDYLPDELEDLKLNRDIAKKADVLMLITDGSIENNNVTFTTMCGEDFDQTWQYINTQSPTEFHEIERV